jgi:hypothetical protein
MHVVHLSAFYQSGFRTSHLLHSSSCILALVGSKAINSILAEMALLLFIFFEASVHWRKRINLSFLWKNFALWVWRFVVASTSHLGASFGVRMDRYCSPWLWQFRCIMLPHCCYLMWYRLGRHGLDLVGIRDNWCVRCGSVAPRVLRLITQLVDYGIDLSGIFKAYYIKEI